MTLLRTALAIIALAAWCSSATARCPSGDCDNPNLPPATSQSMCEAFCEDDGAECVRHCLAADQFQHERKQAQQCRRVTPQLRRWLYILLTGRATDHERAMDIITDIQLGRNGWCQN
jgi:hypothetical protein